MLRYSRSPMEFGGMAGNYERLWMACRQLHGLEDKALEEFERDTLLFSGPYVIPSNATFS